MCQNLWGESFSKGWTKKIFSPHFISSHFYLSHFLVMFIPISQTFAKQLEECGYNRYNNDSPLTERIVGGNSSMPGEWPWQVRKHFLIIHQKIIQAKDVLINPIYSFILFRYLSDWIIPKPARLVTGVEESSSTGTGSWPLPIVSSSKIFNWIGFNYKIKHACRGSEFRFLYLTLCC